MPADEQPLRIEVTRSDEGTTCRLIGSATMETCHRLNEALSAASSAGCSQLVIDMSELDFICSLGLGSIIAAFLRVRRQQGNICLVGVKPAIREMLEITRLTSILPVYDSPAEVPAT